MQADLTHAPNTEAFRDFAEYLLSLADNVHKEASPQSSFKYSVGRADAMRQAAREIRRIYDAK